MVTALDLYMALVAFLSLICPFVWLLQNQLPGSKACVLLAVLEDTDDILRFSLESGVLDEETAVDFHVRLIA